MKELGRRSVASLLACGRGKSKRGGRLSLDEFLDRSSRSRQAVVVLKPPAGCEEEPQVDGTPSSSCHRVADSLTLHRLSKKKKKHHQEKLGCLQRQRPPVSCRGSPHLLVMADGPHPKKHTSHSVFQRPHYNHYADGCGWWVEGMVGMEESGTTCEWEGVACMSLGTSTPESP